MPSSRQILHDIEKHGLRLDKANAFIGANGELQKPKTLLTSNDQQIKNEKLKQEEEITSLVEETKIEQIIETQNEQIEIPQVIVKEEQPEESLEVTQSTKRRGKRKNDD
jgi:hypothetical protein